MPRIPALQSTIRGFSNALNRIAVMDKKFADELFYRLHLIGKISPKTLKQGTRDMFQKSGELSQLAKEDISSIIREHNLSKNATWDDIYFELRKYKEKVMLTNRETTNHINL